MKRVAVIVNSYSSTTAVETVDLALAFGLLEIEVAIVFKTAGLAHLRTADDALRGRWRTLVDFCPATLYALHQPGPQPVPESFFVDLEWLSETEMAMQLATCDHQLLG